jgi:hypothetical protein
VEEVESVVFHLGITPDVVVEIVSNTEGGEEEPDGKLGIYERIKVARYVVFDPGQQTGGEPLRVYALQAGRLVRTDETWFDDIGLGVTLWRGEYQGCEDTWLRWCDRDGAVIPTGEERAEAERERAERLAAKLRAAGIDPDA